MSEPLRASSAKAVGVVGDPCAQRPRGRRARPARRRRSPRRSASKRSTSRPSASARRPQVRVVEAALVGVERVVQRPERALARRPPRPRSAGGTRARVLAPSARSGGRRPARARPCSRSCGEGAARAREVRVEDRRAARPPGPRTWSSARSGGRRMRWPQVAHRRHPRPVASDAHPHPRTASSASHGTARRGLRPSSPTPATSRRSRRRCCASAVITPGPIDDAASATLIQYRLRLHGVPVDVADDRSRSGTRPHRFVDVQVRGPYALWHHTHELFEPAGPRRHAHDATRSATPIGFGPLGELAHRALVRRDLEAIFDFRARAGARGCRAAAGDVAPASRAGCTGASTAAAHGREAAPRGRRR